MPTVDRSSAHRSVSKFIQGNNGGIKEHSDMITQVYIQNFFSAERVIDPGFILEIDLRLYIDHMTEMHLEFVA